MTQEGSRSDFQIIDHNRNKEQVGNMVITRSNSKLAITMKNEAFKLFDPTNKLVLRYHLSKNKTFKTLISLTEVQCLQVVIENKQSWL